MKYIAKPIEVQAWQITYVKALGPGAYEVMTADTQNAADTQSAHHIGQDMTARMVPVVGDYLVCAPQPDGGSYFYLNPKAVFESKYDPLLDGPDPLLDGPIDRFGNPADPEKFGTIAITARE